MGIIPPRKLSLLSDSPDLIPVTSQPGRVISAKKAPWAVLILLAALFTIIFTGLPMSQVLFAGAVLMLLSGMISMEQAYRAIDWKAIFLVAGMLPMALAMQKSGLAGEASSLLTGAVGDGAPIITVGILFLFSAMLTQAVSGAAVAAIMAPIAVALAQVSPAPPAALAMAVALGSSMAFLTPLGHPVNILVMGAGGYRFSDYRRVGWPLFVIITIVVLAVFTLRWNLL